MGDGVWWLLGGCTVKIDGVYVGVRIHGFNELLISSCRAVIALDVLDA